MDKKIMTVDNLLKNRRQDDGYQEYRQEIKRRMSGDDDEDFLTYGEYGKIGLSVIKFNSQVPKYCIHSQTLKQCQSCSRCEGVKK